MTIGPLTHAEDLDRIAKSTGCCPRGGNLELMPSCHMMAGAKVEYNHGVLILYCNHCKRPFYWIAVGRREHLLRENENVRDAQT